MTHVVAILALALVCVLWVLVQRLSGRPDGGASAGACGFCMGGQCTRPEEDPCPQAQAWERRRKIGAMVAVAVLVAAVGGFLGYRMMAGPSDSTEVETGPVVARRSLMGTQWVVTVIPGPGTRRADVEAAAARALDEAARVEGVMSEWRPDSPLSAVNAAAGTGPVEVPDELRDIILRGIDYGDRSQGAFDITWLGMGDLWRFDEDPFAPPTDARIEEARGRVDYARIVVDGDRVGLPDAGMAIGLGGIAKGYAIDRAADQLRDAGLTDFFIDGGGDVLVSGSRDSRPWRVGIRHPRGGPRDLLEVVTLNHGAVVTSGDYERYREVDGVRYHHIIDPRTGRPARGCISVTVVAPTAEAADALATAAFVLGPQDGLALIESEPDTEALLVDEQGQAHMTDGFGPMLMTED